MARKIIYGVGGIVVRRGKRPRVAVVQRSKDERWVLPNGKLRRDERAVTGARREALEVTGFQVRVREFLGGIAYRARGRPKVVQFWRMQAAAQPSHEVTKDIVAVKWLPLTKAVRRLSYPLERLFLNSVGHNAVLGPKHRLRRKTRVSAAKPKSLRRRSTRRARAKPM